MIVNTKSLLDVLHRVRSGLTSKAMVQQSDCFIFHKNKIYTYNDEIAISHPFMIDINGAVPAKEFLNLLSRIKQEEIHITQTDSGLLIKGKNNKANIKIVFKITLPIDQINPPDQFDSLPKEFTTALKFCLFSCSKDMTKVALTCIHCNQYRIESSDNYRVTVRFFNDSYFVQPLLIPSVAAKSLATFDVIKYAISPGWLHFKTEKGVLFSCRTYEGMTFPNVDRIINVKGEKVTLPDNLDDVLKRACVFTKTETHAGERVSVELSDGKLTIKSKGDAGWFEEFCVIPYKGNTKSFDVHPEHLLYIFYLCNTMEVTKNRLIFEGKYGEFIHVVSLLT